jgi:hypothetical protein
MEKQALSADRPGATMVGFWRRAFAFLIDRVVLAIPASALAFPVSATGGFLSVPRVGRSLHDPDYLARLQLAIDGAAVHNLPDVRILEVVGMRGDGVLDKDPPR